MRTFSTITVNGKIRPVIRGASDVVVVTPDETADDVVEVVEAVADAVADVAEEVAEAVADAIDGDGDIDRAVALEHRLTEIEQAITDLRMRETGLSYDDARNLIDSYVTELAATVATEVAAEVADEVASEGDDEGSDADITIVEPDVSESESAGRESFWRRVW